MTQVDKLSSDCFVAHPVWCWDDDETYHLPAEQHEPLPEDLGTLFIRANCRLSGGRQLEGYVIGMHSIFGLGVFVDGREFVFNANLPDFADDDARQMGELLGIDGRDVFPIHYETGFHFHGHQKLGGEFDFT